MSWRLCSSPAFEHVKRGSGFSIMAWLSQDHFFGRVLAPEVCQLLLGDLYLLSAIQQTILLAQLRSS